MIELIGAALGMGAQDYGTQEAPEAFKKFGLESYLRGQGFLVAPSQNLVYQDSKTLLDAAPSIIEFNRVLAQTISRSLSSGNFPIVLGGDHSIAMGTWSGAVASLSPNEEMGLIWIDAHMDSHTPETSESGAIHGMPLAALLGQGPAGFIHLGRRGPQLRPDRVCLIGVRSYEAAEAKLLADLGVRVYFVDEVRKRGYFACFEEARQIVTQNTQRFGVTLDLDALDPLDFGSVGSPAAGGLHLGEVQTQLSRLAQDPRLIALEIVEYNPLLDHHWRDLQKVVCLIKDCLSARYQKQPSVQGPCPARFDRPRE